MDVTTYAKIGAGTGTGAGGREAERKIERTMIEKKRRGRKSLWNAKMFGSFYETRRYPAQLSFAGTLFRVCHFVIENYVQVVRSIHMCCRLLQSPVYHLGGGGGCIQSVFAAPLFRGGLEFEFRNERWGTNQTIMKKV
jgi:hypothetical protein